MMERGLFPVPVPPLAELDRIPGPATRTEESTRDLRTLLWCSIDNDDSLDLDQLTVIRPIQNPPLCAFEKAQPVNSFLIYPVSIAPCCTGPVEWDKSHVVGLNPVTED